MLRRAPRVTHLCFLKVSSQFSLRPAEVSGVVTMKDHHARGREETVHDLSAVVSAGSANRESATRLWQAGMSNVAASEDTGELAEAEPGVRSGLSDPAACVAEGSGGGTAANGCASETSSLGFGKSPVRSRRC